MSPGLCFVMVVIAVMSPGLCFVMTGDSCHATRSAFCHGG